MAITIEIRFPYCCWCFYFFFIFQIRQYKAQSALSTFDDEFSPFAKSDLKLFYSFIHHLQMLFDIHLNETVSRGFSHETFINSKLLTPCTVNSVRNGNIVQNHMKQNDKKFTQIINWNQFEFQSIGIKFQSSGVSIIQVIYYSFFFLS